MLETIVARQIIFYIVGAIAAIGIIARLVAGVSLKRLVKAASNMNKSNHALMRLVRAKFEHACMVSDKVQNVQAFVEKYVFEHRAMGVRLHSWRQLEKVAIWGVGIAGATGAGLEYYMNGPGSVMYQYAIVGAAGVVVLFLLHITIDERYHMEAAKVYMVDFLENTYAHRYEKPAQKEIQVTVQKAEDEKVPVREPEVRPMPPMEEPKVNGSPVPAAPQPEPRPEPERPEPMRAVEPQQGQPIYMKNRAVEEHKKRPEFAARAVSAEAVRSEGEPRNASAYEEKTNAPAAMTGAPVEQNSMMKEEASEQDFPREAKIREILEEFLA